MPVNPIQIEAQINALITQTKTLEQAQSQSEFAKGLATIITNAVLSAQVTISAGAIVTVGSATTQTNATPVVGKLL